MKPALMDSSPDSSNGLSSVSEASESTPAHTIYADVRIVPEHLRSELEQSKSNLEGEIAELKSKMRSLNEKRREALNKIIDIKGSIRVFCRVRPFLLTERKQIREPILIGSDNIVVRSAGNNKEFGFDKVFHQAVCQEDVFAEVKPIVRSALDGRNVCVLAYGQTGTGKTFTMDGTEEQPGIVPRALEDLYHQASLDHSHSLTYSMSMLEIYMGNLKDLLAQRPALRSYEAATKCNLYIQTDSKGFVEIEGLTEVQIPDFSRARWWYNKGRRVRSTTWTNVNDASSRSHCLTRITISRRGDGMGAKTKVSKLWMIDLGGSERTLKTGATGQTLDEGRAINLSLSALGDVIAALRRKKGHVPYRNSKLTQILRDSLGNGSKVLMLVHASPCDDDIGETICSLSFTKRARAVESHRELTEELRKLREKRIFELEEDLREAEEECRNIKTRLQKAEFLLSENKKLFATLSQKSLEDKQNSSAEDLEQTINTPRTSAKAVKINRSSGFFPRFMTSTVASRQRQNASEKEVHGRARSLRSVSRSSVQFSTSQSLSLSDPRLRTFPRSSTMKSHKAETSNPTPGTPKINGSDSKTISLSRSKMVTSSDPNLRATLCRHRRRISNMI